MLSEQSYPVSKGVGMAMQRRDLKRCVRSFLVCVVLAGLFPHSTAFGQELDEKVKPDKSLKFSTARVVSNQEPLAMVKNLQTTPSDTAWRDTNSQLGSLIEETLRRDFGEGSELRVVYSLGYALPTRQPGPSLRLITIAADVRFLDSEDNEIARILVLDIHPGVESELSQRVQKVAKKIGDYTKSHFRKKK